MRKLLFAIVAAILVAGCAGVPMPQNSVQQVAQLPSTVCWWFGGMAHCPPADGSAFVLPCTSASSAYERPVPVIPIAYTAPAAQVVGVIAPTDARGRPMKSAEVCSQYGCTAVNTPAPLVRYAPYQPLTPIWVQPPPVACAKVILWESTQGYGPWGLPSGPPLHRRN